MQTGGMRAAKRTARLFAWSVLVFVGAALMLLVTGPASSGGGRAIVHLLTLGGILGTFYPLQTALWERLYGRSVALPWLVLLVLVLHVSGVGVLVWGFFSSSTFVAHIGGHYLVSTGAALAFVQGVATALKRRPPAPRHLAAHLPGLGLLVTVSLGAMMVLDADGGGYGTYTPHTIIVHAAAGGFLFFLPFVLCLNALEGAAQCGGGHNPTESGGGNSPMESWQGCRPEVQPERGPFAPTALLHLPVGVASLGVLALAWAGITQTGMAPGEMARVLGLPGGLWMPAGLGLLGAVALWVGLPAMGLGKPLTLQGMRRSFWSGLGVLLLFSAIRAGRGVPAGENLDLMRFSVTVFLFAVALPEVLARLAAHFAPPRDATAQRFEAVQLVVLLFVAGMLLVAQLAGVDLLTRLAALPGLVLVLWQARRLWASSTL